MFHSRIIRSIAGIAVLAAALGIAPSVAHALKGDCSQPFTNNASGPLATDCLFILQVATGSRTCATPCICDGDGSGSTVATDALLCLIETVGTAPLACNCPDLQDPAFAFVPADCPFASQQAGVVATNYLGAFPEDTPPATGNWTAGWTIELNGNKTVWEPASGGTLAGGTPSADGGCPAGTTDIGDTNLPAPFAGSMDVCRLAGRYDTNGQTITLTNDNVYRLGGAAAQGTKVGDGDAAGKTPAAGANPAVDVTLAVEPGTLILGEESEALAITRGSNVQVNGTAVDPVVMGSVAWFNAWVGGSDGDSGRGEWGGFILTGFGRANQCNNATTCDFELEGFLTPFFSGGLDDADDSGTITYLVVRQGGFDIDGNGNELNGITLFNVGSETTVNHVQIHENVDDGIEFFGGAVNVDHVVVTDVLDDSIDSDLGYRGAVQFAVVRQSADAADRGFEMDSHPTPASDVLISEPCYVNITVLGESEASTEGANIGSGTNASFHNGIFKANTERCIALENGTLALRGAGLQIHNYYADCETEFTGQAPDTAGSVETWYDTDPNNRRRAVDGSVGVNSIGYPSQTTF